MDKTILQKGYYDDHLLLYDQTIDVLAVGVILYEMVTGVHPFDKNAKTSNEIVFQKDQIKNQKLFSMDKLEFPLNFKLSPHFKDLQKKILVMDPTKGSL